MVAAADFPFHKLGAVIPQPADGGIGKAAGCGIFLCPGNHALGGIHMGDLCAGFSGGHSGASGVGKQVQYLYGATCMGNQIGKPVPVDSLFREQTGMLEAEGL